jgi:hypothetical protein
MALVRERFMEYCDAISVKSEGATTRTWGLIDGTLQHTCRPSNADPLVQQSIYSGHKRHHGLKFQSVVLPDGIIGMMYGPLQGRQHDTTLLTKSNLGHIILENLPHGYNVYGDQAYPLRPWLLSPFRGANKPIPQRRWNRRMRSVRICVEHGFQIMTTLWSHLKYVPHQKVFARPLAKEFLACTALTNLHNCLHPNQVSQYFGLNPPTIEQYCSFEH